MLDNDGVVLTEHEREVLAALASTTEDGWLAQQLVGGNLPRAVLPRWLGPALLVIGGFMTIATFTRWWWIGTFGLALMGFGGWVTWRDCLAPRLRPGGQEGQRKRSGPG